MGVDDLKISTLNVNGLGEASKRRDVFCFLREQKHDIYFLQETHIKESLENYVRATWGYDLWIAGNSTSSHGVAILFNSTFEHKIHKVIKDPYGHYIIMDLEMLDKRITLVNAYGPSAGDNPQFFENVFNLINGLGNGTIISGGDWNCLLNPAIDSRNYTGNHFRPRSRARIISRMSDLDLIDVFRKLYPDKRAYSWRKFNSIKQGRLDYFLISNDLLGEIRSSSIKPGYRSDHSLVTISIKKKEFKRDRTFWKFNNSLLKDLDYVNIIKGLIETVKQQYAILIYSPNELKDIPANEIQFNISDQLFFETLLMEIRGKTISYSSHKQKTEREKEKNLNEKLSTIEKNNPISEEDTTKIEEIRNELEQLRKKKIEGILVRSRANWINEGEKPTHYFCNLENRNFVNKTISFLEKPNGEIIENQAEILKEVETFYSSLYSKRPVNNVDISNILFEAPKLAIQDVDILKREITFHEIALALKDMKNNKSPGPDGFTVEFFKFFFCDIGNFYVRSINEGLNHGKLSITQYQGVITCIPKGDKPKQFLKNWRPISLLNVSYKILSSCIALRIQKVLPNIIHNSQKGFMKGRYIGENIRLLYDILAYTKAENLPGLIITIDFEKAFDSVSWCFIEKALVFFGFPDKIVHWFKTLYRNPTSCITFNGQYSQWFKLERGCRQGDPISPYLYLICAEIMSLMFRKNDNIKGIKLKEEETLISLFADDTTIFLDGSENSFHNTVRMLDAFSSMSGLKVNNDKTQIVWIGSSINCGIKYMTDRNFVWDPGTFQNLGITFTVNINDIVHLNFGDKIDEVKRDLCKWKRRNLTPIGKITLIKTLVMAKLTYLLINLPDPPPIFLEEIDNLITRFLWGGKTNKIRKSTTYKSYDKGGLKMYNIYSSLAAFKISWLKRLENRDAADCLSLKLYPCLNNLKKYGNYYTEKNMKDISNPFWHDVLKHLNQLMKTPIRINNEDIYSLLDEPIQYNTNLKRGNQVIIKKEWIENNIITIRDITDDENSTLMDFNSFKTKYINTRNTHFLNFNGITHTIKQFLASVKNNPNNKHICSFWVWDTIKNGNSKIREALENDENPPTATLKWNIKFPNLNWKTIFIKCFKTTIDTQLQWFQARIIHRILPTRRYLHMCKIVNSPHCLLCINQEETLIHLFWECNVVKKFWQDLENILRNKCTNSARFSFSLELIIFGTSPLIKTDKVIEFIILFAKFYIYKCRFQDNIPNCPSYIINLKHRYHIEKQLAFRRNKYGLFQLSWYPYIGLFNNSDD